VLSWGKSKRRYYCIRFPHYSIREIAKHYYDAYQSV
jgi:hypothetical protein